jgi:hypothetical protein
MRVREWLTAAALAGVLTVSGLAQAQTGALRISVKVPGTLAPVPGAQIALTALQNSGNLLDLPNNEADLLAYLERLAAARGIPPSNVIFVSHGGQAISSSTANCNGPSPSSARIASPAAVTDADGIAVIPNLKPGNYAVRVGREGYLGILSPESFAPIAPSVVSSDVVVSGTVATQVALYLNPAATVSGRVADASGAPVVNACVMLGLMRQQQSGTTFVPGPRALTDDKGNYQLQSVGPGEYAIRAELPSSVIWYYPGVADLERTTELSVEAGSNTVGIDLKLP